MQDRERGRVMRARQGAINKVHTNPLGFGGATALVQAATEPVKDVVVDLLAQRFPGDV